MQRLRRRFELAYFHILHRMPPYLVRRWQDRKLRELVRHAARNVPLWSELMRSARIDPDSIQGIGDLPRLPATRKQTFIGRMTEEYVDNSRRGFGSWKTTSGTSGVPFTFLGSDLMQSASVVDFASFRFLLWRGMGIWSLKKVRTARIKIRSHSSDNRLFIPVADFRTDARAIVGQLAEFKPTILGSYPSVLLDLAQTLETDDSLPRLSIPLVASFGERLSPAARDLITRMLGCEIYDRYGIEEMGPIAVECEHHHGFHIHVESFVVEVTDDAYRPLPEGRYGKIVITDLFNHNMPFIRYDTGDHGVISDEICACGLKTPRLWLEGRHSAYLTFGKRRFHHLEFDGVLDGFMNLIVQYQVVKTGPHSLDVRIVAGPAGDESTDSKIARKIRDLTGEEIDISVSRVPSLPRMPRGKSQIVVDESMPLS